jgi:hypothetical protein
MPFFNSAGAAAVATGRGGFHPSVSGTDAPGSSAAGSLGTSTLSGNGQTIAQTSSSTVTGQRDIIDPWFTGAEAYSIASGSLPPGFALNPSTGQVTGAYTIAGWNEDGTYNFTVRSNTGDGLHQSDRAYSIAVSVPFFYKQIITVGYVIGGYVSTIPFRNVTSMNNATDTTTNKGDLVGAAAQYCDGFPSKDNSYSFGTSDTANIGSARTDKFNMRTETAIAHSASRDMPASKDDLTIASTLSPAAVGYIFGGGSSSVFKFTSSNDTCATIPATSTAGSPATVTGTGSIQGELSAVITPGANKFVYSTETNTGISAAYPDVDGQQKGLSTKLGKGYMGNEGGYARGFNFRVWNFSSETYTTVPKPAIPLHPLGYGEENMIMGQHWGYIMGLYNESTGQISDCIKHVYPTDSGYYMGIKAETSSPGAFNTGPTTYSGLMPGRSSGTKSWRD